MAKKQTGLEKFMGKTFTGGVKIENPTESREVRKTPAAEPAAPAEETKEPKRPGRPRSEGKAEQSTIIVKVDRELKRKLEEVKYLTHKSTLKDVIVEAMNDIVRKYEQK